MAPRERDELRRETDRRSGHDWELSAVGDAAQQRGEDDHLLLRQANASVTTVRTTMEDPRVGRWAKRNGVVTDADQCGFALFTAVSAGAPR